MPISPHRKYKPAQRIAGERKRAQSDRRVAETLLPIELMRQDCKVPIVVALIRQQDSLLAFIPEGVCGVPKSHATRRFGIHPLKHLSVEITGAKISFSRVFKAVQCGTTTKTVGGKEGIYLRSGDLDGKNELINDAVKVVQLVVRLPEFA
jgi:hypothetical protein